MRMRTTDTLDEGGVIFREPEPDNKEPSNQVQVSDPVCGMDVDANNQSAELLDRGGTRYYFCSRDCKDKFERTPEQFITAI